MMSDMVSTRDVIDYPPSNPPGPGIQTPAYTGVSETLIMAGLIAWLLIALGTLALYGRYMSNRRGSRRR